MIHLGDITKISGHTAPIVDCIIGGSPCQDLSVAGKRAGLDGERSGLYIEQVRIVKEMRAEDERNGRTGVDIRPRYMVWENVPGAFSSNKGEDFRIVLEELAKVKDKDAVIPLPDGGKWTTYGCIMGDGWSIAWRVLDAQFWGVPQRRRRIALVADFGGQSASEILFVRKSLSGDTDEGKPKRKEAPDYATGGFGADDKDGVYCFEPGVAKRLGGYVWEGLAPTLRTEVGDNRPSVAYTVKIRSGCEGGGNVPMVLALDRASYNQGKNAQYDFEVSDKGINSPLVAKGPGAVCYSVDQGGGKSSVDVREDKAPTLTTTHDGAPAVCYGIYDDRTLHKIKRLYAMNSVGGALHIVLDDENIENHHILWCLLNTIPEVEDTEERKLSEDIANELLKMAEDDREHLMDLFWRPKAKGINGDKAGTLDSSYYKGCGMRSGVEGEVVAIPVRTRYIVRRLTPLECERLQGYPDGWTDIGEWTDSNGKKRQTSDAARYKALGNSIALPPWKWVLKRLCACYERDATMASLFDGIGGFPYLWEQLNGKGTCLWASEIEEFPIAVTKVRIGE